MRLESIDRAVEFLAGRQIVSPDEFAELSGEARRQAFVIADGLTRDAAAKINEIMTETVREGPSLRKFADAVQEAFDASPLSEAHLERVYRDSVNEAYAQGVDKILDHPLVSGGFPYRRYVAIHDARARPEHAAMEKHGLNGTDVYHRDDPTWLRFRPPWSFNCRCGFIPLDVEDAAARGVKEAREWLETGIEPAHVWVKPPPFAPPAGWERAEVLA